MKMDNQPKVLAVLPGIIPSTLLGIVKPLMKLEKQGVIRFKVTLTRTWKPSQIRQADIVVFCRNCEAEDYKILALAKKMNKKVVYEIDDNFFEIESDSPLGKYHRYPLRLFTLEKLMELSDVIRVYSNPLLERAIKLNPHAEKVKAYFDFKLLDGLQKRADSKIKIVYATSRSVDDLGSIFANAFSKVLDKYGEKVEVYIWGAIPEKLRGREGVTNLPFIRDYNKFVRFFYEMGFDIGIAPCKNDIFHRSKTNNKFREYGASGVAGVYSNVDIYSDCVINGETGMLVENTEEDWFNALDQLVSNDALRKSIQSNAHEYVKKHYSFESAVVNWEETIAKLSQSSNHQLPLPFYDLSKLVILLLADSKYQLELVNRRKSIIDTAFFFGANIECKNLDDMTSLKEKWLKTFDLIVVLTKSFDDIKEQVFHFSKQSKVIFDFILAPSESDVSDIEENVKMGQFLGVSTAGEASHPAVRNIASFPDFIDDHQVTYVDTTFHRIYGVPILTMLNQRGKEHTLQLIENLKQESENRALFYSEFAPLCEWADWLSRIQALEKHRRRKPTVVDKIARKIRRKYDRIYGVAQRAVSTLWLLFRINVLKRYD